MPRKRHDTSEEETDNERNQRIKKSKKSSKTEKGQGRQKEKQGNKKQRRSESSPDSSPLKKRDQGQRRRESESDNYSPVKRGVQSRIERPGYPPRFGSQDSRDRRSDGKPASLSEGSPDRRRRRIPDQSPENLRFDRDPRQSGNARGSFRSISPELERGTFDRPRRDSFDANEYRISRPLDFDRRDRDEFIRERFLDERDRHMQYDGRDFRDNFRDDFRDRPPRLEDRDRFDPRREPISPERGFPRRVDRFSPERIWTRNERVSYQFDRQRSEHDDRFQQRVSFSPIRRKDNHGPLSPVRGRQRPMDRQSVSPDNNRVRKSRSAEMDKSPVRKINQKNISEENKSPDPKAKSEKTGKKKKKSKNDPEGKLSNKNKENRKERSESLERSFERSKQSLVIPDEAMDTKLTESKKSTDIDKGNKKSGKKNASKRARSTSGSPPRAKKSKDDSKSDIQGTDKKSRKKEKKEKASKAKSRNSRSRSKSVDSLTLTRKKKNVNKEKKDDSKPSKESKLSKRSHSRSPSPQERSLNRSRSSDVSLGRKHDMARFESEPESGEITDSEEEGKNALKSQVTVNNAADELEDDSKKEHSGKRSRSNDGSKSGETKEEEPPAKKPKPAGVDMLTGRTGGAYIPPARLRAMQASITDKSSVEYQRISWEALKKSINGLVNKVNVSNIENIVRELFQENIVRGRGLFARSIIQAQSASPTFTHVYAALVSIVNTKFPQNGELVLRRLILQFKRGYKRNDKTICLSATRFVAHLVNQQVAHEVLALEVLTLLLEEPTDDSVEVAIGFLKECGQKLTDVSPRGINAIFERLRNILHESQIDKRVQYMIEVMFAVRKDQFKDYQALVEDLDLVEEEDQFTHLLTLEDAGNGEELLNVFRPDPSFQENEEKYKILKKEILGEGSSDEEGSDASGDDDEDSSDEEEEEEDEEKKQTVIDQTETNMVALRRTIYLTIQSSLDFEECAHKLMKMDLKPGQEIELCNMILDCCAQMRTYEKFFGLLAGRFCLINKKYVEPFENMFKEQYDTIHRLETNKLRNVAKFFSHLLFTDSISWAVLSCIKLNEEDTTSASRIFIKILFQELSEYLGLPKLNERLKDPTLAEYFVGLMPRDNPRDTRFAINFFTTIGLGGLTDDLREHLKDVSKRLMQQKQEEQQKVAEKDDSSESSDSDSDSSSGSDSDSESDSPSDSDSSEDEKSKKRQKNEKDKHRGKEKDNRKDKGKEKNVAQKSKQKEKVKEKHREKDRGRGKEKNNSVKDKKEKKAKKKQLSEAEQQKERDKQFQKLARLANYDEEIIDPRLIRGGSSDRDRRSRKGQENGERRERRRNVDDFDRELTRERIRDNDLYIDRPLERSYENLYDREDRFDGGDKRRRGKRSKDLLEIDRNDPAIRVERNFERMDIYEDKFERDRARNIEYLRGRPEFEDYYEGRSEDRRGRGSDREGRRREIEVDDPTFDARLYRDKVVTDSRRRNRSEERMPLSRDSGRRRR